VGRSIQTDAQSTPGVNAITNRAVQLPSVNGQITAAHLLLDGLNNSTLLLNLALNSIMNHRRIQSPVHNDSAEWAASWAGNHTVTNRNE